MNHAFLQRIRTTLYLCKMVGCAQFSLEKKPSLVNHIVALIVPLPFHVAGIYCIFMAFKNLNMLPSYTIEGEIVKITNLLSLTSTSISFILRSAYYFCRRKHIRNVILQVSNYKPKKIKKSLV